MFPKKQISKKFFKRILHYLTVLWISIFYLAISASSLFAIDFSPPNLESGSYKEANPFYPASFRQCAWYAWGRANEKTGAIIAFENNTLPSAKFWWERVKNFTLDQTPQPDSIAVWKGSPGNPQGHVAYVEDVVGGFIKFTEANYGLDTENAGDGVKIKTLTLEQFKNRNIAGSLRGYIHLREKVEPASPLASMDLYEKGFGTDEFEIAVSKSRKNYFLVKKKQFLTLKQKIWHKYAVKTFSARKKYFDARYAGKDGASAVLDIISSNLEIISISGLGELKKAAAEKFLYYGIITLTSNSDVAKLFIDTMFTGGSLLLNPSQLPMEALKGLMSIINLAMGEFSARSYIKDINTGEIARYYLDLYYSNGENQGEVNKSLGLKQNDSMEKAFIEIAKKYFGGDKYESKDVKNIIYGAVQYISEVAAQEEIIMNKDTTPPDTKITSLAIYYKVGDIVAYKVSATDDKGLKEMNVIVSTTGEHGVFNKFECKGEKKCSGDGKLTTKDWTPGWYDLSLEAIDLAGNTSHKSGSFKLEVNGGNSNGEPTDTTKPTGSISGIKSSYTVGDKVSYTVKASDNKSLAKVTLQVADVNKNLKVDEKFSGVTGTSYNKSGSFFTSSTTGWAAGTYYYTLFVVDSAGNTYSTNTASFTLEEAGGGTLSTPVLSSPTNGATDQSKTPTLSWSSVAGATTYRVFVSTSSSELSGLSSTAKSCSSASACVVNGGTTSSTFYQVAGSKALSEGTTYYWMVRAGNSSTGSKNSDVWSFTTSKPMPPDLSISSVNYPGSSSLKPGSSFKLPVTVAKSGGNLAGSYVEVKVYLSTDTTITSSDTLIGISTSFSVRTLNSSGSTTNSISCAIPSGQSPGAYYIGAIADSNGYHSESNEDNNANYYSGTVMISSSGPSTPTGVSASDGTYPDKVAITWNNVTGAASYNVYRGMSSSGSDRAKIGNPSSTNYDDATATAGTKYYYWVTAVDSSGTESSYSANNLGYVSTGTSTTSQPDLTTSSVNYTGASSLSAGSSINVPVTVARSGGSLSGSYVEVKVYLSTDTTISSSDTLIGTSTASQFLVSALNSNGSASHTISCATPSSQSSGTYYIGAIADSASYFSESNENNNTNYDSGAVTVQGSPGNIDTTAPANTTASNFISSASSSVSSTSVMLSISATDAVGVTGYYASETSTTPTASSSWTSVASTPSYSNSSVPFTLSSGDGTKTVYVWFKDAAGNVSAAASGTITLSSTGGTVGTNCVTGGVGACGPGTSCTTALITTASPVGGTISSSTSVTLSCRSISTDTGTGCKNIYYTTDGSTPTTCSSLYSSPMNISKTTTLKFFSTSEAGNVETIRTENYTFTGGGTTTTDTTAPTTTASPATGSFTSAQSVTLSCSDTGGSGCAANKTYYTTDGTTPTTSSSVYSSAISISTTTTLKFFSVDGAGNPETVKTETYTFATTTVTDIDGNVYNTVTIGTQVWMKENLKVTKYRDGTAISTTTLNISAETSPKYQWAYNDDESNVSVYGRLYTGYAAIDSRGVCPASWHVPSDAEWTTLTDYLGGESVAGGKMKEAGTTHWNAPNTGADNSSGFSALPGGNRNTGSFPSSIGDYGNWWSATEIYVAEAWRRRLNYDSGSVYRYSIGKNYGLSVRCVKD